MAEAPKILGTDSLRTAYPKLNTAIDMVNNFQTQINTIVIEGDSSVEAAQARVASDGTTFSSLKERLDTENGSISAQLTEKSKLTNKRLDMSNSAQDTLGTTNIANFAGQGSANAPIGQIIHHYTDGIATQIDNVGDSNTILVLKNANNPSRRPDKPTDFIGTGKFLELLEHQSNGLPSKRIFTIDKTGNLLWFDGGKTSSFGNNKPEDNTVAFKFSAYEKHSKLFEIENAYQTAILVSQNLTTNILSIIAGIAAQGLKFETINGNIELKAGGKQIILNDQVLIYDGTAYLQPLKARRGTTAQRPTDTAKINAGDTYFDTTLNKPIWRNKDNNGWVDATGAVV